MPPLAGWSFRLYRAFGIDVRIHWSLPLFFIYEYFEWAGEKHPQFGSHYGAVLMGALFASVLIHEYGHALAARFINVSADTIILQPLGGFTIHGQSPSSRGDVFIAFAGPAAGILAGGLCLGLLGVTHQDISWEAVNPLGRWGNIWQDLLRINIVINAANLLIPAQPFDGGQIWTGILTPWLGYSRALKTTTLLGILFGLAVVAAGIHQQSWLIGATGFFVIVNCIILRAQLRAGAAPDYDSPYAESIDRTEDSPRPGFFARWKSKREAKRRARLRQEDQRIRDEVDLILDKVKREGMEALTPHERAALNQASKRIRDSGG